MKRSLVTFLLLCGLVGLASNQVLAVPVTYEFAGTIKWVGNGLGSGLPFSFADPVSGRFTFESSTTDSDPAANTGKYIGAVTDLAFSFGGYNGALKPGAAGDITLLNDLPGTPTTDYYQVRGVPAVGGAVNGWKLNTFNFQLRDDTLAMLSSDDLFTEAPSPYQNNNAGTTFLILQFAGFGQITDYQVRATVDSVTSSLTPVPEPSSIALLGLGLFGLLAAGRYSRGVSGH